MHTRRLDRAAREPGVAVVAAFHRAAAAEPDIHVRPLRDRLRLMHVGRRFRAAVHFLQPDDVGRERRDRLRDFRQVIGTPRRGVSLNVVADDFQLHCVRLEANLMLSDLDALMNARNIDVVIVPMHEAMHSSFRWLSRGAKVTRGYAVKFAGRSPMIVTYPMECGEAAATGLEVRLASDFGRTPEDAQTYADFFANIAGDAKTIAFYGNVPIQLYGGILERLGDR